MLVSTFEVIFLHQLQGCLPLVLMFDVKEDIELEQGQGNFGYFWSDESSSWQDLSSCQ